MQNFDDYNEKPVMSNVTKLCGKFSVDLLVRILDTINHALAIGLGFLTSVYVQNDFKENDNSNISSMFYMAVLSVLVSYGIEYVRFYSRDTLKYDALPTQN